MPMGLDRALFGNGRGLKSPFHDNVFYWLVDTKRNRRGQFYTWLGGFGAQLLSREWFTPRFDMNLTPVAACTACRNRIDALGVDTL
jgi:hypothetical protein